MKKLLTLTFTLVTLATLAGCQPNESKTQASSTTSTVEVAKQEAKITLKEDNNQIATKTVQFKTGESLYDAMKANFAIKDEDGFITSIDDHQQDKAKNKYWTYTINGEMAMKGAKDITLKENDTIVFNLGVTQ
jgi:hypothetical protein